jgi:NAD+ synthase
MRATTPLDPLRGRVPLANIKPRLRMATLYFYANSLNYLVAGTGNRSELAIGYFTKYGDGGCDLLPIGHLVKSEVRAIARDLNVPQGIVDRTPSAGLWLGQTDEEEMGFTYADLERYLEDGPQAVSPALAMRIERLMRISEHKRQMPPIPDVD